MLKELKFRGEVIWSTAMALVFGLGLALVGCGDDGGKVASTDIPVQTHETVERVALPAPPPELTYETVPGEAVEASVVSEPEGPREVTYAEAEAAFLDKRYEEAVELFTRYVERRPQNPWGHYMLGLSGWKAGEPGVAEAAFELALELDPAHVKSWLNWGRVLLDAKKPEEALAKIEEALILDPASNAGLRLQGRAHHQLGRPEDAIESYRQALRVDDRDAWSMNNLGLILIEQERFDEALTPLARAVELRDDVAVFQNNLGMALERTGHFRAAEAAYAQALAISEAYERAEVNRARVEGLEERPDLEPLDLAELARSFVDEIQSWREAVVGISEPEAAVEPIAVVEADTIPGPERR